MAVTERRLHPRRTVRGVRAWMFVDRDRAQRCRIVDVSRKGVLVESPEFLVPGTRVELAFAQANGSNVTRLVRRWAHVARSTPKAFAAFFVNRPQLDGGLGRRSRP